MWSVTHKKHAPVQDSHLGRFDANQAPNIIFDSLRIHAAMLTPTQIAAIANGGASPANPWTNYCFSDVSDFGVDVSPRQQNLTVHDSRAAVGLTQCGPASTATARPIAFQLPGSTASQYARQISYTFPPTPFTVEGFIKIDPLTATGRCESVWLPCLASLSGVLVQFFVCEFGRTCLVCMSALDIALTTLVDTRPQLQPGV